MNFVVMVSDTLRRDHLGCYGNDWISTPNIDRFAQKSLILDRAYSASFPTVPHRRDVMTGRFTASYTPWAPLDGDEVVLAQVLSDADYTTMMICDCPHILENGYHYDRGFTGFEWIRGQESDRWKTHPEFPANKCDERKLRHPDRLVKVHRRNTSDWRHESDRFVGRTMATACDWLEDNYQRSNFFLYVDTFDPHEPWDAPQWYIDMYNPGYTGEVVDYPLYAHTDFLTESELKHCRALYAAEVTLVDRWVGRVFDKIDDLGLIEDTVVIFTTDHGFLHGEHGIIGKSLIGDIMSYIPLYEEINHIPFIVSVPGRNPARSNAVVQPMDIMPTILDIAGVDIPETVHGSSFRKLLEGKEDRHRDVAFSTPYLGTAKPIATVVRDNWTAVIHPEPMQTEEGDRAVDGMLKRQQTEAGDKPDDLLFDVSADPGQQTSVAADHPEIVAQARADFIAYLEQVGTDNEIVERWITK